jgi:hypothetical protein
MVTVFMILLCEYYTITSGLSKMIDDGAALNQGGFIFIRFGYRSVCFKKGLQTKNPGAVLISLPGFTFRRYSF